MFLSKGFELLDVALRRIACLCLCSASFVIACPAEVAGELYR